MIWSSARRRALAMLLAAYTLSACTADITQLVVVIDSDLQVPAELDRVSLVVEAFGTGDPIVTNLRDRETGAELPLWTTLVHSGGPLGPITIRAVGTRSGTEVVSARVTDVRFVKDGTRQVRVLLLRRCIADGAACVSDCSDASCLTEWKGPPTRVDASVADTGIADAGQDTGGPDATYDDAGGDDAGGDDAGDDAGEDAGVDAGVDAGEDAGPIDPCSVADARCFTEPPSNFDPSLLGRELSLNRSALSGGLLVSCGDVVFDSTLQVLSGSCVTDVRSVVVTQSDDTEAVVIPLTSLSITGAGTLRVVGSRPVIFAIYGDARVDGVLDATGAGAVPGAGGNVACMTGTGAAGAGDTRDGYGGSGGGGGAFGSHGGAGGRGDRKSAFTASGLMEGDDTLVPLRGGCAGGRGGAGTSTASGNLGGGGGGALQVSVAGTLNIGGVIAAGGGGGQRGTQQEDGGGGGGSGGAILLEAASVMPGVTAWITANGAGGGGAGGHNAAAASVSGSDGPRTMAVGGAGGAGDNRGGNGGRGASSAAGAVAGQDGETGGGLFMAPYGAGGGGGGGGHGRVRVIDLTQAAGACAFPGNYSPAASLDCRG